MTNPVLEPVSVLFKRWGKLVSYLSRLMGRRLLRVGHGIKGRVGLSNRSITGGIIVAENPGLIWSGREMTFEHYNALGLLERHAGQPGCSC